MSGDARTRVEALLASQRVMTLASTGTDGPWAAPVFYAEHLEPGRAWLVFVSAPSSRHCAEFVADARAAAAVYEGADDWRTIRGVQIAGRVLALDGNERERAHATYARKFPQLGDPAQAPEPVARAFARVRWFALRVERAFLTDNTTAFGQREEVVYEASGGD